MRAFSGVIVAALLLTGCTTMIPASVVLAGRALQFIHASEVNRSCVALDIPKIEILAPPQHGKVKVMKARFKPDGFKPDNSRYKCRNTPVDGVVGIYTPDPDFIGKDSLKFRLTYHFNEPADENYRRELSHKEYSKTFDVR